MNTSGLLGAGRVTLCEIKAREQDGAGRASGRDVDLREVQPGVNPMGSSTTKIVLKRIPIWVEIAEP